MNVETVTEIRHGERKRVNKYNLTVAEGVDFVAERMSITVPLRRHPWVAWEQLASWRETAAVFPSWSSKDHCFQTKP